jgi:hypothetical protein
MRIIAAIFLIVALGAGVLRAEQAVLGATNPETEGHGHAQGGHALLRRARHTHVAKTAVRLGISGTPEQFSQLQASGLPLDTFAAFIGWWPGKSPQWFLQQASSLGATPFISWEPDEVPLQDITNGSWDEYLALWAQTIRAYGQPVYLRFAHEMNGLWYSWSKQGPTLYKEAWRHVFDVFQAQGATNARFVWTPDGLIGKPINEWKRGVVKWYPGRKYVSDIGMSTVEFHTSVQWGLPFYFGRLDFLRDTYHKQMVLPEMKVVQGDRYHWLRHLREYLDERPWFKVLIWSETPSTAQNNGQFETGNMNWSLLSDPLARFLLARAVK